MLAVDECAMEVWAVPRTIRLRRKAVKRDYLMMIIFSCKWFVRHGNIEKVV